MSNEVVIAGAHRTAIGRLSGTLAGFSASDLAGDLIRSSCQAWGVAPDQVDEVVLGQALAAGAGQNPARRAALRGGLGHAVPALGVSQSGASGLAAVALGARAIACGSAQLVLAGGHEAMSRAPHLLPGARAGRREGDWTLIDAMHGDGLCDAMSGEPMGATAETLARRLRISRTEQDEMAALSQERAENAGKHGVFESEIRPLEVPQSRGDSIAFARDECPVPGTTVERLAVHRPEYRHDGTVTKGNGAGPADGAALVMLTTRQRCAELGLTPLARLVGQVSVGVDPAVMGIGAVTAAERLLADIGWSAEDADLIELDEAFAVQLVAARRQLRWPIDRLNVNGGALALGYPIGAAGARALVTLVHEMQRRDVDRGLVCLGAGGGLGLAMALARPTA